MIKSTIATLVGFIISFSAFEQELTPQEMQLDQKLKSLRNELIQKAGQLKLPLYNSSFTQLRPFIESSSLYKIIQAMPKGGLLHCHNGAITNPSWLISNAARYNNCYIYTGKPGGEFLYGQLAVFKKDQQPTGFVPLQRYLKKNKSNAGTLLKLLTLNRHDLAVYMDTWAEFEKRFDRLDKLVSYRPFFKEYFQEAMNELIRDNVQHVEIRAGFGPLFDENNDAYPSDTIIGDIKKIIAGIQKTQPAFTVKFIYAGYKFQDTTKTAQKLQTAFQLKKKYPELISGFDLVADEAPPHHTVGYYNPVWNTISTLEKQYGVSMPLYMHAGESSTIADTNLQEVPFQFNKRIGHGLNLVYFPEVMQRVKAAGNLVEVSPISNQELGYVSDLRNHPARVLLANGIPFSINSDDPGIYGYDGLSYDFWVAFMDWDLDVKTLKKLIVNSITYSSLTEDEKKAALIHLNKQWDNFVEATYKL